MSDNKDYSGSPKQIAAAIGEKLERLRLSRNITQSELAKNAGISERTLRRLESGAGATLDTLVRILVALRLQENVEHLVPDPRIRPVERVRSGGTERQRSRPVKKPKTADKWHWKTED